MTKDQSTQGLGLLFKPLRWITTGCRVQRKVEQGCVKPGMDFTRAVGTLGKHWLNVRSWFYVAWRSGTCSYVWKLTWEGQELGTGRKEEEEDTGWEIDQRRRNDERNKGTDRMWDTWDCEESSACVCILWPVIYHLSWVKNERGPTVETTSDLFSPSFNLCCHLISLPSVFTLSV